MYLYEKGTLHFVVMLYNNSAQNTIAYTCKIAEKEKQDRKGITFCPFYMLFFLKIQNSSMGVQYF